MSAAAQVNNVVNNTYIPRHGERTERNDTMVKVAAIGAALGAGLFLAALFGSLSLFIGAAALGVSLYALGFVLFIDHSEPGSGLHGGGTKLHRAAVAGDQCMVNLLLFLGANPNTRDGNRDTPLHLAAYTFQPTILDVLVGAGGNVDARGNCNQVPLHYATEAMDDQSVAVLVRNGALPNNHRPQGISPSRTPLEWALADQESFRIQGRDRALTRDNRTCEQRIAAVDRIVQMLNYSNSVINP